MSASILGAKYIHPYWGAVKLLEILEYGVVRVQLGSGLHQDVTAAFLTPAPENIILANTLAPESPVVEKPAKKK
jgi:hypothetical protein